MGETHPRAKLSDEAVNQLHALRARGTSLGSLALMFGIAKSTARDICNGRIRANTPHRFSAKPRQAPDKLIAPLPIDIAEPTNRDDWVPRPAPTVESLALPQLHNEEPGQRAMRLIGWAVLKGHHDEDPGISAAPK